MLQLTGAVLDPTRAYRYVLWRIWQPQLPKVLFIGLNPSCADERQDDPTLRRCMGFARAWGYGGVLMANLFALRSTNPEYLKTHPDPIGPANNRWLQSVIREAPLTLVAWGNQGALRGRDETVLKMLPEVHCLAINHSGQPRHPLYIQTDAQPRTFRPPLPAPFTGIK